MPELENAGLRYATHPDVYDPSDDTWLLMDCLDVQRGERFLEVGCGAGLVSILAARRGAQVVSTDVNPHALRLTRENARRNQVSLQLARTDLLSGLRSARFDAVAFNPPYLPTEPGDRLPGTLNRAFDGGATGRTVTREFVEQLSANPPGRTWLLASTLQDQAALETMFRRSGFSFQICGRKPLSHETLLVYDLFPGAGRTETR